MKEKPEIMNELDKAIDAMDTGRIDHGLEALAKIESLPFQAENSELFAARIRKLKKDISHTKKPRRFMNAAVVAAAIMAMGVTAYAANALNVFTFIQDDKVVVVRSSENVDRNAMQVQSNPDTPVREDDSLPQTEYDFNTAAEAEKELDIKIALPSVTSQMVLESATGTTVKTDELDSQNVCLSYADLQGRNMSITITKLFSDAAVVSEHDLGDNPPCSYINKFGTDFIQSDQKEQTTYFVAAGEYEYSISFTGFTENEQKEIVDTLDLSEYQ